MSTLCYKVQEWSPSDVDSLREATIQRGLQPIEEVKFNLSFVGYLRDMCGIRPNILEMGDKANAELAIVERCSGQGSTFKELDGATVRFYRRERQEDTLIEKLRKLGAFEEYAQRLDINVNSDKAFRKQQILLDFYQENPLAQEVADGKASYAQLIQPIYDRFEPFWKRMTTPKIQPDYDQEVRRVLGSMNHVGCSHLNINVPTTLYRKTLMRAEDLASGITGLILGGGVGSITYDMYDVTSAVTMAATFLIGAPIIWRTLNAFMEEESSLGPLKEAAHKTDEFLHKNRI